MSSGRDETELEKLREFLKSLGLSLAIVMALVVTWPGQSRATDVRRATGGRAMKRQPPKIDRALVLGLIVASGAVISAVAAPCLLMGFLAGFITTIAGSALILTSRLFGDDEDDP